MLNKIQTLVAEAEGQVAGTPSHPGGNGGDGLASSIDGSGTVRGGGGGGSMRQVQVIQQDEVVMVVVEMVEEIPEPVQLPTLAAVEEDALS